MEHENFSAAAANFPDPFRLLIRDRVESTNDEVRALAEMGAAEGLIILAKKQTLGRGRRGAAWFSQGDNSLTFSILVRSEKSKVLWSRLALTAGLALAESMESYGLDVGIKWPNDILIKGKKVAGILVEAADDFAIVGIGINVNTAEFPPEISSIATSLKLAASQSFSRAHLLEKIIQHFAQRRRQMINDFGQIISAVQQRCVLTGNGVILNTAGGSKTGTVEGISSEGEILLRTEMGLERLIEGSEVRLLKKCDCVHSF